MSRRASTDVGFSLVEVLIAVVLLGMAVAGTLPAVWGNVHSSGLQREYAAARRWVVSAGELAESDQVALGSCFDAAGYATSLRVASDATRPAGWAPTQLTVTDVLTWNGTSFEPCSAQIEALGLGLQQLRLRVASPDGGVTETLDVIKAG